jgi:hypothetical protein
MDSTCSLDDRQMHIKILVVKSRQAAETTDSGLFNDELLVLAVFIFGFSNYVNNKLVG